MPEVSRTTIRVLESTYRDLFAGCTDRNPDLCACGAADVPVCSRCDEQIEDGDRVIDAVRWTVYDGDPEWHGLSDNEIRHVTCPAVPRG